jgi:hypothetical protein
MAVKKILTPDEQLAQDTLLLEELKTQYDAADKYLAQTRDFSAFPWTEREALFLGGSVDKLSKTLKSQVNTQDLQNMVIDGSCRVMAQFPTGKVQALSKNDRGKNILMNLVLDNYILEHANAQWDMFTKFRVWNMYSRIYGAMPALVTYRVDEKYIGPEFYILHPRHFRLQAGKTTVDDADFGFADTWVSLAWLKQRSKKVWRNIDELAKKIEESGDSKSSLKTTDLTYQEQQDVAALRPEKGKYAQVLLRTRYERKRWITYSPKHNLILRETGNTNGDDDLPFVMKQCFPLMDRLYGLGEFERGKTLAYAINSLVNLYMDGVKMSIFPPLILNQKGIVPSSIKYGPGQKWLEMLPNSIRQLELSPQGMNTFQSTYGFLKSALMNMGASSDTSVSKAIDPGMGKTPQALDMQAAREGARDSWDRFMQEQAIEKVYNKFINMLSTNQEKPIKLHIFKSEIEKIKDLYPEENILSIFDSGEFGELNVDKSLFREKVTEEDENGQSVEKEVPTKFRFYIDHGTTMKKDEAKENQTMGNMMALVLKNPQIVQSLERQKKTVDLGEMFKRYLITSGTQDWDKIIIDLKQPESVDGIGPDGATIPGDEVPEEDPAGGDVTDAIPDINQLPAQMGA